MKKFTKLSLATAVALSSLSSLSADFIDSSTFSGYVTTRFDSAKVADKKEGDVTSTISRFHLNIETQVTDDVKSFVALRGQTGDSRDASDARTGDKGGDVELKMRQAYVDFAVPGVDAVRVKVGRSYTDVYDTRHNSVSATADLGMGSVSVGYRNQAGTKVKDSKEGSSSMFFGGNVSSSGLDADFDYVTFNPSKNYGKKSELFTKGSFSGMGATVTGVYAASTPETGDKGSYMGATASYDVAGWTATGIFASTDKKAGVKDLGGTWSKYNLYISDVEGDVNWGSGALTQMSVADFANASTVGVGLSGSVAGLAVSASFASNKAGDDKNTDMAFTASKEVVKNLKASFKFASATKAGATAPKTTGYRFEAKYSF